MKILNQTRYEYLEKNCQRLIKEVLIFWLIAFCGWIFIVILKLLLLGSLIGFVFFLVGIIKLIEIKNYRKGIEGEKAVIENLQQLDDSWSLINDVKIIKEEGNIDHILISSKGVFVLETKNWKGRIECDGNKWVIGHRWKRKIYSPSTQAKFNASLIRNLIKKKLKKEVSVIPICVFVNPYADLVIKNPTIEILKLEKLIPWLQRYNPEQFLSNQEINLISQCILNSAKKRYE